MQLKDIIAYRRQEARSSRIQARELPNLVTDEGALEGYGLKQGSNERSSTTRDKTHQSIGKFVDEFNKDKKHHEGITPQYPKEITIPGTVYPDADGDKGIQKAQTDWLDDVDYDDDALEKVGAMPIAMFSWRGAQRAAEAGGIIRFLTLKDRDDLVDGSYWATFKAYELTKEGTNVEEILRYNDDEMDKQPKPIWKKGDKPLGSAVNWSDWKSKKDDAEDEVGKDQFEKDEDRLKDEAKSH
ncbi:Uu.00g037470.m01.CDS01 [Anthostomella pinea]|uniref:Uu.00g037470.m01.CDS01 n=1 Tax=Anthostomella pinea TaxID=933095 RepID=A0AAI8YB87_9PEZI|nr:Uu.00g037470.m01.CDS01 [Anthostomella pinea]